MTPFERTVSKVSALSRVGNVSNAVSQRDNIFALTQAAEDAVLRPQDVGAFGHDLRAALAARIARLASDETLVAHYLAQAGDRANLVDPTELGTSEDLSALLAFVDKVANQTRDIVAQDVSGLKAAGISDADIVRICELVAFLAYQVRVIAGLRLMQGAAE